MLMLKIVYIFDLLLILPHKSKSMEYSSIPEAYLYVEDPLLNSCSLRSNADFP